jgi:hypothetical protein
LFADTPVLPELIPSIKRKTWLKLLGVTLQDNPCNWEQLGNLLSLCREMASARDILQKFENLKKQHELNFTGDFAFLRRRSRKLNCWKNFANISSMESIYIT